MITRLRFVRCLAVLSTLVPFALSASAADNAAPAKSSAWSTSASVSLKETYDSNLYLQDVTRQANQDSLITTIIPSANVSYKPSPAFGASLSYGPEVNFFHSESDENFVLHRTGLTLGGQQDQTSWEIANAFIAIDGGDVGPTFTGPGGAPAAGGPAIRDRRDAFIERGHFKLTHTFGRWFVRPVLHGYYHDFQSDQRTTPGYLNFVDRNDLNGGADLGFAVAKETWLVAGYRYGAQNQDQLLPAINPVHYDNTYHRVLFGVEGKPWSWLKLAVGLGPEFRRHTGVFAAGFDQDETYLYVDSVITITPTAKDTFTVTVKRYEQPGFGGRSTYLDSTYDLTWRHRVTDKLTVGAGVRAYNTDFLKPVLRDDWIYTGHLLAAYSFNKKFSGEISYSYDDAQSKIPNTSGREYTRHAVAIGFKYALK